MNAIPPGGGGRRPAVRLFGPGLPSSSRVPTSGASAPPAAVPAPVPLPAPVAAPVPTSVPTRTALHLRFARWFFDREDPYLDAGDPVEALTWHRTISLGNRISAQQLIPLIEARIAERVEETAFPGEVFRIVDYDDARFPDERPRRFLVMRFCTRRETLTTANAHLIDLGDRIDITTRTFILWPMNAWKLLLHVCLVSLVLLGGTFSVRSVFSAPAGLQPWLLMAQMLLAIPLLAYLAFRYRHFIGNLLAHDGLNVALRKLCPGSFAGGAFDADDLAVYIRIRGQALLGAMAEVLEEHGLDASALYVAGHALAQYNVTHQYNTTNLANHGVMTGAYTVGPQGSVIAGVNP